MRACASASSPSMADSTPMGMGATRRAQRGMRFHAHASAATGRAAISSSARVRTTAPKLDRGGPHGPRTITMAAMIHVAAVVPELTVASDTHYPWLVPGADIIQGSNLPIAGGKMQIPKQPGVGVEIDRDKLANAHETYLKCGMRQRDDAATMRMVEPGWSRELF